MPASLLKRFSTFAILQRASSVDPPEEELDTALPLSLASSASQKGDIVKGRTFPQGPESAAVSSLPCTSPISKFSDPGMCKQVQTPSRRKIEAAMRVHRMREFLGAPLPLRKHSTLRSTTSHKLHRPHSEMNDSDVQRRASTALRKRSPEQSASNPTTEPPPDERTDDRCDSAVVALEAGPTKSTADMVPLPPLVNDILWLSLCFVEKAATDITCQVCDMSLEAPLGNKAAAWRLCGCDHYTHVSCLKMFIIPAGATLRGNCQKCKSLVCQFQRLAEEEQLERIQRVERMLCPGG